MALIVQQPAIQPNVAMARTGPNSFRASANRAKAIVDERLKVGDEHSRGEAEGQTGGVLG